MQRKYRKHKKSPTIIADVLAYTGEVVNKVNLNKCLNFLGSINSYEQLMLTKSIANNGDVYVIDNQFNTGQKTFHKGDTIIFIANQQGKISYTTIGSIPVIHNQAIY